MGFFKNINTDKMVNKELLICLITKIRKDYISWSRGNRSYSRYIIFMFNSHDISISIEPENINYPDDRITQIINYVGRDNISRILNDEMKFYKIRGCGFNYFSYK